LAVWGRMVGQVILLGFHNPRFFFLGTSIDLLGTQMCDRVGYLAQEWAAAPVCSEEGFP